MVGSAAPVSFPSERRSITLDRSPAPWKIALPFSRRLPDTTPRTHAAWTSRYLTSGAISKLESRGLLIGVERAHFFYDGVTEDTRRAVETVLETLQGLGATIVDVDLPELAWSPQVLMTILGAEASTFHRRWLRERPHDYDPATRRALEMGEFIPATHYLLAQRARSLLRRRMANLFSAFRLDVLLSPTLPMTTVPLQDRFAERADFPGESPAVSSVHHTFSANLTGQPAMSIPCGLSSSQLPIGFQLMGRPFDEAMLFRVARAYEREHAWSTMRPEVSA